MLSASLLNKTNIDLRINGGRELLAVKMYRGFKGDVTHIFYCLHCYVSKVTADKILKSMGFLSIWYAR
jgi:hypothetical protein